MLVNMGNGNAGTGLRAADLETVTACNIYNTQKEGEGSRDKS